MLIQDCDWCYEINDRPSMYELIEGEFERHFNSFTGQNDYRLWPGTVNQSWLHSTRVSGVEKPVTLFVHSDNGAIRCLIGFR